MINWGITSQGVFIAGRRLLVTRAQLMLLMVAMNLAFLGLDILFAHGMNGTLRFYEWVPVVFGPIAAVLLLVAGAIAFRRRTAAILLTFFVLAGSLIVGLIGAYFHIERAFPPGGAQDANVIVRILVFAPPVIAPLTFSLVSVLGVIAVAYEHPADSGNMIMPGFFSWRVPFSKTRQYFIWVGLGILATLLSSVLDHERVNFENARVWIPTIVGVFAAVTCITMGLIESPNHGDYITYVFAMVAMIMVGVLGLWYHIEVDLTSRGTIVVERFLRGAPFLAPMLFADMGTLGLIILWPIRDTVEEE